MNKICKTIIFIWLLWHNALVLRFAGCPQPITAKYLGGIIMQNEQQHTPRMTEDEARITLKEYIAKTKKSQATVSKELGFSDATISQFLNNTYRASTDTIVTAIEDHTKLVEKRDASPKEPKFKMTSTSLRVFNLITYCHEKAKLCVAYGDPGMGKTMAIAQYEMEHPGIIVITANRVNATITGINELLAKELKIKSKNNRRIAEEIIPRLKASKKLIIIDEAQHLKLQVIDYLRSIVDATRKAGHGVGVMLVGNAKIYNMLVEKADETYQQVGDRVARWQEIRADDTKVDDINLIFSDINNNREALEFLYKISRVSSIRRAVEVFTQTLVAFGIDDYSRVTVAMLARIANEMNMGLLSLIS